MPRHLQPPSSDLDDEIVPDSELEFEDLEGVVQNESSDSSSDNFVPEESSESDVPQDRGSSLPLRVSMATTDTPARPSSSKAGPSSRASRGHRSTAVACSEAESSDSSDSDDSATASKRAPRKKKATPAMRRARGGITTRRRPPVPRRGRGRGGRAEDDKSGQESDVSDGLLEPSDGEAKPPPKGLDPHQTRALIKVAERRMRKKLGRKLTVVRPSPALPESPYIDSLSSASSVTSQQPNSTSSTQSSRAVGEISRRQLPSSPRRRRSSPRTCWSLSYHSSRKVYTG